ncbi:Hypothetical predicted protein [Octopus vulgaris]|uniref:Uncharacterized protein n=1 Tax=Octopus vulgaris TaxID=6645 RepID=A0AA36B7P4_OCTVU|nr:Hypothetical predicted protein [Octopus vulgaris]
MDYEEVIGTIGGCGLYQKLMLSFLFASSIMDGLQVGSMVFIVPDLDYRCAIPGYDNDTYKIQSEIHEELINEYIPKSEDEGEVVYEKCLIYSNTTENGNRTTQKCSSWVYDKTNTHTSITTQDLEDFDDHNINPVTGVRHRLYLFPRRVSPMAPQ